MSNVRSTIYEVARRSGVSTATVSRAMHGRDGLSAATRERVLAVASELGWVPNGRARGLATKRAGIIGVLFHDIDPSGDAEDDSPLYVDQVVRGAERAATDVGDAVLIAVTRGRTGRELAFAVAGKVDGFVLLAGSLSRPDAVSLSHSVPVVTVATRSKGNPYDDVSVDNRGAMRSLVDHLVGHHGYTDLVFIGGPSLTPDSKERFAGYREALRSHGVTAPRSPEGDGGFTEVGGARAVTGLLAQRAAPRAVVCGNDEMAIGAISVLRKAKLRIPGDVAVTGFDDIASARHIRPALTTVRQPMRDVGEHAVKLLLERVQNPQAARRALVLPTEIRIRHSCGCGARPTTRSPGSNASPPRRGRKGT